MNDNKLYHQIKTYTFQKKYEISLMLFLFISMVITLPGSMFYFAPPYFKFLIKFGVNETVAFWITVILMIVLPCIVALFCSGYKVISILNVVLLDRPPITVIKYYYPKALTFILDNPNTFDKRFFHISIGENINLDQEFPEYKNFKYADVITRKNMNQVVMILINRRIIIKDNKHKQVDIAYQVWKVNV